MSADVIVRFCAPTLAGLKVGNLFSYRYEDVNSVIQTVEAQNRQLNPKGVYLLIVKIFNGLALVYVYRKQQLEKLLASRKVQLFLMRFGYRDFSVEACLEVLKRRLKGNDFPHDIGVFLGYPLDDIQDFIDNKGANCPCVGCWKAYNNISEAQKKFRSYKKCTQIYCQRYDDGTDIARLTVAG